MWVVNLPEWTGTGLITGSDWSDLSRSRSDCAGRAYRNSWLYKHIEDLHEEVDAEKTDKFTGF